LAGTEVHGAGESITAIPSVPAAKHIDHADNPIVAAGVIVDPGIHEFHPASTKAITLSCLPADGVLANVDGLLCGEAVSWTITARKSIATTATATATGPRERAGSAWTSVVPAAPKKVERVAFRAALRILDADDSSAAVARVADQILPATAINARKAEAGGVAREGSVALEAAPRSRLASQIPNGALVAADLDLGGSIDHHFYGALAAVGAATADHHGSPLVLLRTCL
jgi:hypothetical protein